MSAGNPALRRHTSRHTLHAVPSSGIRCVIAHPSLALGGRWPFLTCPPWTAPAISPVAQAAQARFRQQHRRCVATLWMGGCRNVANPLADDGPADGGVILRQLVAGADQPILVADFQAFSSAPRLSDLVSDRAEGRPVYQVDPLD